MNRREFLAGSVAAAVAPKAEPVKWEPWGDYETTVVFGPRYYKQAWEEWPCESIRFIPWEEP